MDKNFKRCDFCPCECDQSAAVDLGWKILPGDFFKDRGKEQDVCPTCVSKVVALLTNIPVEPPPSSTIQTIDQVEQNHILSTLELTKWNKSQAAHVLGIERSTLDRKLRKYEVSRPKNSDASQAG